MATPIADMVAQLLSGGIPPESIVAAVRAAELAAQEATRASRPIDEAAERRRAYDRKRKREKKDTAEWNSTGMGKSAVDVSNNTQTNKESKKEEHTTNSTGIPPEIRRTQRGARLQPDSQLTDEYRKFALEAGLSESEIHVGWAEFVDYWVGVPGQRGCKLDWFATWRNRVRELLRRRKPSAAVVSFRERKAQATGFYASSTSKQLEAWDKYRMQTEGKQYPRDRDGGWMVPAEWPPITGRVNEAHGR